MMKANQSQKAVTRTLQTRKNTFHIISLLLLCLIQQASVTNGQLLLRQDGTQNSYSVTAPGSQISFSRFFGGNAGQLLSQPLQQQQQQPLLYNQAPTQFLRQGQAVEQTYSPFSNLQNPASIAYIQNGQQPPEQYSRFVPTNPSNLYALDLLRQQYQQQQEQLLGQQNHLDGQQNNYVAAQQARTQYQTQEALQYTQGAQVPHQPTQTNQQQQQQLLGTLFSPSNEVSQVQFSSTGLNYTF